MYVFLVWYFKGEVLFFIGFELKLMLDFVWICGFLILVLIMLVKFMVDIINWFEGNVK